MALTQASNIVYDYKSGFIIDAATGVVLDRIYDFEDWLNPRFDEQREFERKRRHSSTTSYMLPKHKELLWTYYRAVEAAHVLNIDSRLLRLELKRVLKKTASNILYKEYRQPRREHYLALAAAALYAATRLVKVSVSPRNIIDVLGANPWIAYKFYAEIKQQLGLEVDRRREILQYIDKFVATHNYPDRLYYWCLWVLSRLDDYFFSGRSSRLLAAAIIDLARILRFNEVLRETKDYWKAFEALREFTLQDITKALKVSEVGTRLERYRIMEHLEVKHGIKFKAIDKYGGIYLLQEEVNP